MSLDLSIISENGAPNEWVGISVAVHLMIVEQARKLGLGLLARLNEYYQDAEFAPDEVGRLIEEVKVVAVHLHREREVVEVADRICNLLAHAVHLGVGVSALSD